MGMPGSSPTGGAIVAAGAIVSSGTAAGAVVAALEVHVHDMGDEPVYMDTLFKR